ncbi:MAG: UDP-2,3-diacylglucosamine diphosphatase [Sulfurospirillum sp.]|nr:MAG: UDP-2,3-diacylglucosamine diphosphatase [Sulfurospirillum sp.]
MIEIKEGALFISDAHDNVTREAFYRFLCDIDEGEIKTEQLFLMGDMFDLLVGQVSYTHRHYRKTIDLINRLSRKTEIIYLEGNHDFNLRKLFPAVTVIPIQKQPVTARFHEKSILLSHGDWNENATYRIYAKLIRNPLLLTLLNLIDHLRKHTISKSILKQQQLKYICKKSPRFHRYIKQKIQTYDIETSKIDFICEGHHHQNREFVFDDMTYKNFSAYACDKSYYKITFTDKVVFKEVHIRG